MVLRILYTLTLRNDKVYDVPHCGAVLILETYVLPLHWHYAFIGFRRWYRESNIRSVRFYTSVKRVEMKMPVLYT